MAVKRYEMTTYALEEPDAWMEESDKGDYVLASEYDKLAEVLLEIVACSVTNCNRDDLLCISRKALSLLGETGVNKGDLT